MDLSSYGTLSYAPIAGVVVVVAGIVLALIFRWRQRRRH